MPVPSDLTLSQLAFLRACGNSVWGVKARDTWADPRTIGSLLNRGLIELHKPAPLLSDPSAEPHPEGHWQPTLKALRSPVWPNQPHRLA